MTTYAGLYGPEALIDGSGHPITSATIDVFTHGTTTHVSLYQDNARVTPLSNPVPNGVDGSTAGRGLDTFGNLSFYVDPGRYDLRIATGAGTRTVEIEIETDPAESAASGAGLPSTFAAVSGVGTDTAGTFVKATVGSNYTRTLPSNPAVGTLVAYQRVDTNSAFTLTVAPAGSGNINGDSTATIAAAATTGQWPLLLLEHEGSDVWRAYPFIWSGPAGPTGPAGTVTLGTVTTGAAGSSATITNSGTSTAAVLNFTIPRGDTGAAGANGAIAQIQSGGSNVTVRPTLNFIGATVADNSGSTRTDITIASGTMQVITRTVVGIGGAATIDFSSIPSTYEELRLSFLARGDTAATNVEMRIKFNNDSSGIYDYQEFRYLNGSAANGTAVAQTIGRVALWVAAASATAGNASVGTIEIPSYARTVFNKAYQARANLDQGTTTGDQALILTAGTWKSTAAINQVTLSLAAGNFAQGSVVTLFGVL